MKVGDLVRMRCTDSIGTVLSISDWEPEDWVKGVSDELIGSAVTIMWSNGCVSRDIIEKSLEVINESRRS